MKETTIRINRLELRLRGGGAPHAADLARKIAGQIALRRGEPLPGPLETALTDRLAAPLDRARRK